MDWLKKMYRNFMAEVKDCSPAEFVPIAAGMTAVATLFIVILVLSIAMIEVTWWIIPLILFWVGVYRLAQKGDFE